MRQLSVVIMLTLIVAGGVIYKLGQDKTQTDKQQMQVVQKALAKHVILPVGEDPTLATVTNTSELKDAFLKDNAQSGDKVLVYYKTQKVFIYRPRIDKLVASGPMTIQASAAQVTNAHIRVRNGTTSDEAVNTIQDILTKSYKAAVIEKTDASSRHDYPETIVIDLTTGDKYDLVSNIAQSIGAVRGILPAGETAPEGTDILIITGVQ